MQFLVRNVTGLLRQTSLSGIHLWMIHSSESIELELSAFLTPLTLARLLRPSF